MLNLGVAVENCPLGLAVLCHMHAICVKQNMHRVRPLCVIAAATAGMSAVLPQLVAKVDADFRKGNLKEARAAQDTLNKW